MSLTLRTDFGCTEAIIEDDCGLKRFYEVANILSDDLEIKFSNGRRCDRYTRHA